MALSDCSKCWETPCTCGYGYANWSRDYMIKFIISILSYFSKREKEEILNYVIETIKQDNDII